MSEWTYNVGHGWVVPRQDGVKSRCGGPALCMSCQAEAMMLRVQQQAVPTHRSKGE